MKRLSFPSFSLFSFFKKFPIICGFFLTFLFLLFSSYFLFSPFVFAENHLGEDLTIESTPVFGSRCTGEDCEEGLGGGSKAVQREIVGTGIVESNDIIAVALGFVKFFLALLGVIAFIAFLWSGALYITAFANEENAESAKKTIVWTSIGIIVILISYALVSTLIRATVNTGV